MKIINWLNSLPHVWMEYTEVVVAIVVYVLVILIVYNIAKTIADLTSGK